MAERQEKSDACESDEKHHGKHYQCCSYGAFWQNPLSLGETVFPRCVGQVWNQRSIPR